MRQSTSRSEDLNQISPLLSPTPKHAETFSIYLGTQYKTQFNFRLETRPNIFNLHTTALDSNVDLAIQASTLSTLYSCQSQTAVISPISVTKFKDGSFDAKFLKRTKQYPELHFPPFLEQISQAGDVAVGDVFITRHSNMPHFAIVFHLLTSHDLPFDSQSAMIQGYRSILEVCGRLSINCLVVPISLGLNVKKAEIVLKCSRGLFQEMSKREKHASETDGVKRVHWNVVFAVPEQKDIAKNAKVWESVRQCFMEVFRPA